MHFCRLILNNAERVSRFRQWRTSDSSMNTLFYGKKIRDRKFHSRCHSIYMWQKIRKLPLYMMESLQWRHNGCDSVSNHQPHDCLLNRLYRRRSKKTSKLRVTGLCAGNSPVTGEFPAQMAGNAENVSIWWRHHVTLQTYTCRHLTESNQSFYPSELFVLFSMGCLCFCRVTWNVRGIRMGCVHYLKRWYEYSLDHQF